MGKLYQMDQSSAWITRLRIGLTQQAPHETEWIGVLNKLMLLTPALLASTE
jgi:hypothetical protein